MEDKIVYFACNNWHPSPKEADRLIYEHFEKDVEVKESVEYFENFIKENKLCVNMDVVDMSVSYYITAKRSFFEEKFPELIKYVKEEPYNFLWKNDKKLFLEYKEDNIGFDYFNPKNNGIHR